MVAILLQGTRYCSPACARAAILDGAEPTTVSLQDPQLRADRAVFRGDVADDDVVISRHDLESAREAMEAIDTFETVHDAPFRVAAHNRVNIKVSQATKDELDSVKDEDETWNQCLQRLVQLDRATRLDQTGTQ